VDKATVLSSDFLNMPVFVRCRSYQLHSLRFWFATSCKLRAFEVLQCHFSNTFQHFTRESVHLAPLKSD
jgi:hypothetical protein